MRRLAAGLAALLFVAGCSFHHGPRSDTIGALIQPAGVTVELRLAGSPDDEQRELTASCSMSVRTAYCCSPTASC